MSENVGASTSHNPKDLHSLYRENFTFTYCIRYHSYSPLVVTVYLYTLIQSHKCMKFRTVSILAAFPRRHFLLNLYLFRGLKNNNTLYFTNIDPFNIGLGHDIADLNLHFQNTWNQTEVTPWKPSLIKRKHYLHCWALCITPMVTHLYHHQYHHVVASGIICCHVVEHSLMIISILLEVGWHSLLCPLLVYYITLENYQVKLLFEV
jgi:hypothetical protein